MRSRSNSCVRLDNYNRLVYKTILKQQNSVTGLLPASATNSHAWIRDNVFSITAAWALSLAYKKAADLDEDRAKAYELEQATVKCMRGLLKAMMRQRDRLERFKESFSPKDSIHAKFASDTGLPVVGDHEWGHLQVDAVSLYLLILAQITASGLQVIFTLDEVAFVQNLVFFIESAYCIPDYGVWERGDKTNTGIVELNASSIGMAKAALESVNELDLFGARGGQASVIHVNADNTQKCHAVLQSMLPRESLSKETDAALLTVIGFPAFAVESPDLIEQTCQEVVTKLGGRYGCKRFLRDGYHNPREDSSRLHYEPWELRLFENVECQWPLFFCYLVINSCFLGDDEATQKYSESLNELMVKSPETGLQVVPQLYTVPPAHVAAEEVSPGSQDRVPKGKTPFIWAQSLYVVGRLMKENFIAPGELDPTNRRLSALKRPDVVVQVVVLAKNREIQELLSSYDIHVKTRQEVVSVEVHPARVLSYLYTFLGKNEKLGLTGRRNRDVGILTTSKLYRIQEKLFAFTPQRFDVSRNYMDSDMSLMMTTLEHGLNHLSTCWKASGRPLITLILGEDMLDNGKIHPAVLSSLKKLKNGYINGTRVTFGSYEQFLSTSYVRDLSFLGTVEDGQMERLQPQVERYLTEQLGRPVSSVYKLLGSKSSASSFSAGKRKQSTKGAVRRTRSIRMAENNFSHHTPITSVDKPQYYREDNLSDDEKLVQYPNMKIRSKLMEESPYGSQEADELVQILAEAESLDEQEDILHYLVNCYGLDFKIKVDQADDETVEVRDLVRTVYEAACAKKNWAIVRSTAGFLSKRVEDLSKAVTDLLVRQKQVTVGMPPHCEVRLSGGKLTTTELREVIYAAYEGQENMAMLTQELIVYLAMFIQAEPQLFHGMLRLRIGLIIQVMASEMARSLKIKPGDASDASEELVNLSPFEMKNLLHHIMSGREFGVHVVKSGYSIVCDHHTVSKKYIQKVRRSSRSGLGLPCSHSMPHVNLSSQRRSGDPSTTIVTSQEQEQDRRRASVAVTAAAAATEAADDDSDDSDDSDGQGSWMRRRRLDGALNRVPLGFYSKIWKVLERSQALSMQGNILEFGLTQEMTSGELKFALRVEGALNTIPEPEFRQLLVEALMVLSLVVEHNIVRDFGGTINVEAIVRMANQIFLQDQFSTEGDATLCCAQNAEGTNCWSSPLACGGTARICRHFYDSAPSGTYGTMSYLVRACCIVLDAVPKEGDIDCHIS